MRWSKLKQNLEARLADSLQGRLSFHLTQYRMDPDRQGRAWIVFDDREIWGIEFPRLSGNRLESDARRESGQAVASPAGSEPPLTYPAYYDALLESLSLAIDDALQSDSVLIRGLALLDRRCGKRRLRGLAIEHEDALVRRLYAVRTEAEGMRQ